MTTPFNFHAIWSLIPSGDNPRESVEFSVEEYKAWMNEEALWALYQPFSALIFISDATHHHLLNGLAVEDLDFLHQLEGTPLHTHGTIQVTGGAVLSRQVLRPVSYSLPQLAKAWKMFKNAQKIEQEKTYLQENLPESTTPPHSLMRM